MNMTNLPLDAVTKTTEFESLSEAFAYGLPTSLFGIAVVFGVLALIWGILSVMKIFLYNIPMARKNKAKEDATEKKSQPELVNLAPVTATSGDNAIVAAIIAAICAFRGMTGENGSFRVVSFKKRK